MSDIQTVLKNLGHATAYAYAKAGGYTGTEEEFTELLGNIATDLDEIENLSVVANGLPSGSDPTASYADGVLTLGIPKGDKGDGIAHVSISTLPAGSSATASYDASTETLSLGIPKGDKGDTGATGNGIASIAKTGTSGNVDTYTITYTNGNSTTFTVTNGNVSSVAGKTGAVVLDGDDVSYSDSSSYQAGTIGKEVSDLKSAITKESNKYASLINPVTVDVTGYIDTDGKYYVTAGHLRTNYCEVHTKYLAYNIDGNAGIGLICFYTSNIQTSFISAITTTQREFKTGIVEIPQNAKYYSVCFFYPDSPGQYVAEVLDFDELLNAVNSVDSLKIVEYPTDITEAYLNKSTGAVVAYSGGTSTVSDFVPITFDKIYYTIYARGNSFGYICYYDINKAFISSVTFSQNNQYKSGVETVPQTAYYVRFCKWVVDDAQKYYSYVSDNIKEIGGLITDIETNIDNNRKFLQYKNFLRDSIIKPITFNGKKLYAFGDSITYGVCSPNLGNAGSNKYISLFCAHVGATLVNKSVSGSCVTDATGVNNSIYDEVTNLSVNDADIIWIAGGVNDYVTGKPLGEYGSTNPLEFYGALDRICNFLQTNYPNAVVLFITPVNVTRTWDASVADLDDYRSAIYQVATKYKYNVVDGNALGLPDVSGDWGNDMIDDSDGCHPTILGHYQYYKGLCTKLI